MPSSHEGSQKKAAKVLPDFLQNNLSGLAFFCNWHPIIWFQISYSGIQNVNESKTIPLFFYFMTLGVLLACMSVTHACMVSGEVRRGSWISWD